MAILFENLHQINCFWKFADFILFRVWKFGVKIICTNTLLLLTCTYPSKIPQFGTLFIARHSKRMKDYFSWFKSAQEYLYSTEKVLWDNQIFIKSALLKQCHYKLQSFEQTTGRIIFGIFVRFRISRLAVDYIYIMGVTVEHSMQTAHLLTLPCAQPVERDDYCLACDTCVCGSLCTWHDFIPWTTHINILVTHVSFRFLLLVWVYWMT